MSCLDDTHAKAVCLCVLFVAANMAFQKIAFQSSTYGIDVASYAVDGDINLEFDSCTNAELQPWLAIDLGTRMDVGRVCVTNNQEPIHG